MAEEELPDLILLDMNMPGMNGKEVCRRLRAHPKLADTPIIMFSAEAAEKMASFEMGADDFLVKPTDPDEMIDRIENLLAKRATSGPAKAAPPLDRLIAEAQAGESVAATPLPPETPAERPESGTLIAVLGVRGGSGATTLATNLAVSAGEIGLSTTLVDLDTQQGHVGLYLKLKPKGYIDSLASLQDDRIRKQLPGLLIEHGYNLRLLLARPNLSGRHPTPSPRQAAIIVAKLVHLNQCVVVDLGREITATTRAVLDGADQVIVCLRPERVALASARAMLSSLKETLYEHTTLRAMVFGAVGGLNLPKSAIERFLAHPLLAIIPAQPKTMMQALNKGVPYVKLYPDSKVAKFYRQLAKALVVKS